MSDDNVNRMWSDDELDRALATLHAGAATDEQALAGARAELVGAAGGSAGSGGSAESGGAAPRRHWGRWAIAAAAVVALVAGFLVVQTVSFGDRPPVASAAAAELNKAADKIGASDPPVAPGQYRYIGTHAWHMASAAVASKDGNVSDSGLSFLEETLGETWAPAVHTQEWLLRRGSTGNYKWINGSDEKARKAGFPLPKAETSELRAPCGDFYVNDGEKVCQVPGSWQRPTPDWIAKQPRDPRALHDVLRAETAGRGQDPDLEMLVYVADALRSGLVPADLRAALYRTLALVPALEITDRAANLDGKVGVAYGVSRAGTRQEMIIDPGTGQFIGERQIAVDGYPGIAKGTVMSYTSVTTAVVDSIGARPTG